MTNDWIAIYTHSRREKQVSRDLAERGIEHFLPLYRAKRQWAKRRPVNLELPLFPNYVFVSTGMPVSLLKIPGVISVVGGTQQPWPLASREVERLRVAIDSLKFEPCTPIAKGERVRIRSGLLAGMEGILMRTAGRLRVVIMFEGIRSGAAVELDEAHLEPIRKTASEDSLQLPRGVTEKACS